MAKHLDQSGFITNGTQIILAGFGIKSKRIRGGIDIDEFKELKNPLVPPNKVELEQQIIALEKRKVNRLEPLRNWILEAKALEKGDFSNTG